MREGGDGRYNDVLIMMEALSCVGALVAILFPPVLSVVECLRLDSLRGYT